MWFVRIWQALSLVFLGVAAFGLMASGGGQDPSHMHVVIGGTSAERAQALAAHLAGEFSGRYEPRVLGLPDVFRGNSVSVISLSAPNGGGPAVLSGANGVDFTGPAALRPVLPASSRPALAAGLPILSARFVPAPDPPPRPV